ncbi:DeoR/GlpR family DNA-binding transcription regulator [Shinella daejeonensis]|uniref:DeoR/GlpR family DNA-binding transcription regulator n=1 Tax=Shinella daejeonensis TaxID=659017 RepID=UPI0020C7B34A|nr:DeoR/GlpR family DNA-binding transcription regulator [Shinella daejeonensis]MCP8895913.1 DeoR/GlpR family DNA-binding transcription regulator [Shinella daejeonensis]
MSGQDLLLGERQDLICQRLDHSGRVIAAELAQELGVSEDTIRRDLREMAASGLCRRVYGGALRVAPARLSIRPQAGDGNRKAALARAAARAIPAGSAVFLDAGSTNLAIARALAASDDLTVATNAPAIAAVLIERGIATIQIGGTIDPRAGAAIGAKAMRDCESFRPDVFVLGVCGIDREAGVTAHSFEEAEFKRFVASLSRWLLVALTNEKFSTAAPYPVVSLTGVARAVLERDADAVAVARLASAGIEILRAK